jgi:hypothetical protein
MGRGMMRLFSISDCSIEKAPMVNHSNQRAVTTVQLTWQAIFWRLLITLLLLLALAGPGLNIFSAVTARPDTQVLPTLTQDIEPGR